MALFNDSLDDEPQVERIESFGGGMDGFTRATLLPPDASQYLENAMVLENLEARTRFGADALGGAAPAVPANPTNGLQGLAFYYTSSKQQLLTALDGAFYKWEGAAWSAVAGWAVDAGARLAMAQGIDKLYLSDGVNNFRSWDGTSFTELVSTPASPTTDPPAGASILVWHAGRLIATGFPGSTPGKETDAVWACKVPLAAGAGDWDSVNWQFRVGGGDGDPIVAAASLPAAAGETTFALGILKQNSVYLVNADPTAANAAGWTIQLLADNVGCVGKRALCQFGNDLLFMAWDGVRSLRRMTNAAGQFELSPPVSLPLQRWIDRINWDYASIITAHRYKELALFAVPIDGSTTNNAVLVFNGRLQKWVGVWTGWTPTCFETTRFNGTQRLVIGDTTGLANQWKDYFSKEDDAAYTENGAGLASKVWTRSMVFGDMVLNKLGYHAETRFTSGNATVTVTAVCDNVEVRRWDVSLSPSGPVLPVVVPFVLGSGQPATGRRSLRGLSEFNEVYLKIESPSGWFVLRNVTASAFLQTLRNQ